MNKANTWVLVKKRITDKDGVYLSQEHFNDWHSIGEPQEYLDMIKTSLPYQQWLKENKQLIGTVEFEDIRN